MGIWSRSLLMEIKEATGFAWLQGYVKYIWMVHPQRLYYSMFGLWWMVCVLHNAGMAEAAGGEIVAGETVGAHISRIFLVNNNYIGVKQVPFPHFKNTFVEGYQQVQISSAFYSTGWHLDGWKCIPLRPNQTPGFRLPDVMITNGVEVIPFEFKCTSGSNFNTERHMLHMTTYKNTTDVLAVSCLQQSAYTQASTLFLDECIQQNIQHPEVMLTLLTANELWEDLPSQLQQALTQSVELHKQQITQKVYDTHNNAMDAHTAAGGTPATLYTAQPNTEVKQQLIATLLENMKLMGLTKQGCLLSQHKLTHLD